MKKPWWIRVIGILGLLFAASTVVIFNVERTMPGNMVGAAAFVIFAFLSVALLGAWAVMSFVLYVMRHAGKQQAAIMRDVASGLGTNFPGGPVSVPQPPQAEVWDNPATKIKCDGCGRYHALLWCGYHMKFLCFPCTGKHDSVDCFYYAAGRRLDDAHKQTSAPQNLGHAVFGEMKLR